MPARAYPSIAPVGTLRAVTARSRCHSTSLARRTRRAVLAILTSFVVLGSPLHASPASAAGWQVAMVENFDGSSVNRQRWGVYDGGNGGDRVAEHAIVRNGQLTLRTTKVNGVWKGAGISAGRSNHQRYGKYEMRVRFDRGYGVRVAGLLWPSNGVWPPEVDFYEIPASNADRTVNTLTTHYGTAADRKMHHEKYSADFTAWQTVGLEWTPGKLVYTLNGRQMATMTQNVPSESMWFGVQTRPGSWSGIVPNASTPAVVDLDVDWIKIYRYTA